MEDERHMSAKTYTTLADIVRAKIDGTLDEGIKVCVDNDSVYAQSPEEDDVWEGDTPREELVNLLTEFGINADRV